MRPRLSDSAMAVPRSRIRELADIAFGVDGVIRLYFGESNVPTPEFIKEAAVRAMRDGFTFYTENAGLLSTRQALAEYYERHHGVRLNPANEIVITASGVQALNLGIRCVLDPGDEAILLTPAWPNATAIASMCNATPVEIAHPLRGDRYEIDVDVLEAAVTPRTRLLIYTSPSNPLGWVATAEEQRRLLEFCRRHNLWLMADEVYERIYYSDSNFGEPVPSILRLATRADAVIVAQSFSKSYCMTGWRLGWIVSRPDLAARAAQLNEFIVSHAPSFTQKAGEVALRDGEASIQEMLVHLEANRDYCVKALNAMPGVTVPRPDGAFYLFPRIVGCTDSFALCRSILKETKVGIAPGVAFGNGGEGSVRICYASERPILEEAMEKIAGFLASNGPNGTG